MKFGEGLHDAVGGKGRVDLAEPGLGSINIVVQGLDGGREIAGLTALALL